MKNEFETLSGDIISKMLKLCNFSSEENRGFMTHVKWNHYPNFLENMTLSGVAC